MFLQGISFSVNFIYVLQGIGFCLLTRHALVLNGVEVATCYITVHIHLLHIGAWM